MRTLTADSRDTSIRFRRRRRGALTDTAATNELTLAVLFFVNTFPSRSVEFWWVGAHLDHDPSLINLVIGARRVRVVPGIGAVDAELCCGYCSVRIYDRAWIAAGLTGQVTIGVILVWRRRRSSPTASSSVQCPASRPSAQCPTASPTEAADA